MEKTKRIVLKKFLGCYSDTKCSPYSFQEGVEQDIPEKIADYLLSKKIQNKNLFKEISSTEIPRKLESFTTHDNEDINPPKKSKSRYKSKKREVVE